MSVCCAAVNNNNRAAFKFDLRPPFPSPPHSHSRGDKVEEPNMLGSLRMKLTANRCFSCCLGNGHGQLRLACKSFYSTLRREFFKTFVVYSVSCVYEASKELISFSDENAFIWNKLFCEEGDKKHSYKSSGNNGLSSFYDCKFLKGGFTFFFIS